MSDEIVWTVVLLLMAAGAVWAVVAHTRQQSKQADAAIQLDGITEALRRDGWQPPHPLPCGCEPARLCLFHADVRALDGYSRPGETAGS